MIPLKMLFIFLASVSAACAQGWTGWHPTAWTTQRLVTAESVTMCAVSNGPFIVTNYSDGAAIVSTQWFFSDIEFGQPCGTSPVANSWAFTLIDSNGVEYVEARGWTGIPQSVTMKAQARDCVAIDAYLAMRERWEVAQNDGAIEKPRFYRDNRDALVEIKRWMKSNSAAYVLKTWDMPDYLTNSVPHLTNDLLVSITGMPDNWLDHTPYRNISAVANGGASNQVSGYWTLTGKQDTNGVWLVQTNVFIDSCGNVTTNAGAWTNGQTIAFRCTNDAIQVGRVESDYGWRYARPAFSNLVLARYQAGYSSVIHEDGGDSGFPYDPSGDDWWTSYAAAWNTSRTSWEVDEMNVYTGLIGGASASMAMQPEGGVARVNWSQWYSTGQRPAIPLPKTNAVTVSALEVTGYRYHPESAECDPPNPDPCANAYRPTIERLPFSDNGPCWTNTLPTKTVLSTGYAGTVGVYRVANPWPDGNVLSFGAPSDPPQPPYEATPLYGPNYCDAEYYLVTAEAQAFQEMDTIFVRWDFDRR